MPYTFGARAHDYPGQTPAEHFSSILADDMTTVQLAIPKSFGAAYPTPQPLLDDIRTALTERNMIVTVLGCYINPALADEEARLAQVNTYISAMPAAKYLNARCIGTETTRFVGNAEEHKAAMDRLVDSMKRMSEAAEQYDVYIGVEPVSSHTLNRPELVPELLERVGGDRIRIIFDPINLITPADMADQTAFLTRCKECFGDKIVAIHVKDFRFDENGRKTEAGLFQGDFDWNAFLRVFKGYEFPMLRDEGAQFENKREFEELRRRIAQN